MKTLVIIPTLNEKTNIFHLYKKLKKLNIKFDMLFVDDNSDDENIILQVNEDVAQLCSSFPLYEEATV